MVGAASLLAAGSKNLSTFVSAKERVKFEAAATRNWGGRNVGRRAELRLTKVMLPH